MTKSRGCRISRVRMKNGGAEVRILVSERERLFDEVRQKLLYDARTTGDEWPLAGYALVAWTENGTVVSSVEVNRFSRYDFTTIPDYVRQVLKRH